MAFPLEAMQVLSTLQSIHDNGSQLLPPITFLMARHLHGALDPHPRAVTNNTRKKKRRLRPPPPQAPPPPEPTATKGKLAPLDTENSVLTIEDVPILADQYTIDERQQRPGLAEGEKLGKFAIPKFFKGRTDDTDSDSDIDDGEIKILPGIGDENTDDDGDLTEKDTLMAVPYFGTDESSHPPAEPRPRRSRRRMLDLLALLANLDFGVWVDKNGNPVRKIDSNDALDEDLGITEDSMDDDDSMVLLDLAFTDIDALLMMLLLALPELFIGDLGAFDFGKQKKKPFSDTYLRTLTLSRPHQPSYSAKTVHRERLTASLRKPTLHFEKVDVKAPLTLLSLSSIIHAKLSANTSNPLNYYAFVNSGDGNKMATIGIFIPPQENVVLTIEANENVAVADCIGYVLLKLTEKGEKLSLINPNHWQLELVDEDGEEYGAFGLLNRTKALASYNNPPYLGLKPVLSEADRQKNDQATPLAMEFKNNLAAIELRKTSMVNMGADEHLRSVLRVLVENDLKFIYVHPEDTLGAVLQQYCAREGLDYNKYKFREIDMPAMPNKVASLLLPVHHEAALTGRYFGDDDRVADVAQNAVELVLVGRNNYNLQITPGLYMHLTPAASELRDKLNSTAVTPVAAQRKRHSTAPSHRKTSTKYSLDDFFKQTELSNLLGALWYKWRVWRKKPTMLNKIEKLLIVDGDYIHLAPLEEHQDHMFLPGHDHHHLSHYNYSKFYKQMLEKTLSFHVAHLLKVKQNAKLPSHLKIVVKKVSKDETKDIKKKYFLEAESELQCKDIIDKLHYAQQMYSLSQMNG